MIYEQYTQFGCPDELGPQLCRLTSQTGLPLACSVALNLMDVFKAGILTKTMSSIGVKKQPKPVCLTWMLNLRHFGLMQNNIRQGFLISYEIIPSSPKTLGLEVLSI